MAADIPMYEKRIVYQVPEMDKTRVQRHTVGSLTLDQYLPAQADQSGKLPAVLLVHGGPIPADLQPQPQDWGVYVSYGQLLGASGLMGLMFNHRYFGKDGVEQSGEDIKTVLDYLDSHAGALGLDRERLCVWLFSGAGKLLPAILRHSGGRLKSLVVYYALIDIKKKDLWPGLFSRTPLHIVQAGLDHPKLNASLDQFVQQAQAAGANITLLRHDQGHHGFDILDDDDRSREIIRETVAFIRAHL